MENSDLEGGISVKSDTKNNLTTSKIDLPIENVYLPFHIYNLQHSTISINSRILREKFRRKGEDEAMKAK